MAKKSDLEYFLDGLETAVKITGAIAIAGNQIHQALSQLVDDQEEAIAPEPDPRKQLPPARPRRKNG